MSQVELTFNRCMLQVAFKQSALSEVAKGTGAVRGTAPNGWGYKLARNPYGRRDRTPQPFLRDEAGIRPCPPAAKADL